MMKLKVVEKASENVMNTLTAFTKEDKTLQPVREEIEKIKKQCTDKISTETEQEVKEVEKSLKDSFKIKFGLEI
jgi:cell shape-determining protein MreC